MSSWSKASWRARSNVQQLSTVTRLLEKKNYQCFPGPNRTRHREMCLTLCSICRTRKQEGKTRRKHESVSNHLPTAIRLHLPGGSWTASKTQGKAKWKAVPLEQSQRCWATTGKIKGSRKFSFPKQQPSLGRKTKSKENRQKLVSG